MSDTGHRNGTAGAGRIQRAKLVLLGDTCVGKSSLAYRFVHGQFSEYSEATVGADFITQTVQVQGQIIKFGIWDTAGEELYHCLAPIYYRGAQAAIVVYDVNNAKTFDRAILWVKELRQQVTGNIVIVLAGNKVDLASQHRAVQFEDARAFAEEAGLIFVECSAKSGHAVNELFLMIAHKVTGKLPDSQNTVQGIRLTKVAECKSSGCSC